MEPVAEEARPVGPRVAASTAGYEERVAAQPSTAHGRRGRPMRLPRTTGALAAGAWFAIGPSASLLWHRAGNPIGTPTGGHVRQAVEWLGYFHALGVLIAALAAFAMGRFVSRPRVAEEPFVAAGAVAGEVAQRRRRRRAPWRRDREESPGES